MFGHGKKTKVYVNGYNLTGYLNSFDAPVSADVAETSVFGSESKTYVAGQKYATLQTEGFWDGSADAVDEVLHTALGTDNSIWSYYPQGDAVGQYGYGYQGVNSAYSLKSTKDDACRISASAQSNVCAERILSLHTMGEETASGNSASQDNLTSTSNGGSAYIQATDVTGTVEVIIQHSANGVDWTTLASFTAISADNACQRVAIQGNINRYVRCSWTLGVGETLTFNVGLNRA